MQIIVPMSGTGSRFQRAGYRDIKPLIDVDGAPMIRHVINMFPGEDELRVYIYELKRFLQWGTPEDLEEYLGWSRYFRQFENWRPSRSPACGTNLIPMAGAGVRFSKEGFTDAKPLVNVDNRTIVERSLECLPPAKNWVAVCQSSHLRDKRLAKALGSGS